MAQFIGIYEPGKKKYNDHDFYCGKTLNELAITLFRLAENQITLQYAYDSIVNDVIIKHVIKNSDCECKEYLEQIEHDLMLARYDYAKLLEDVSKSK